MPIPKIDGTQIATKTPADLSTTNQRYTENKNEIATAIKTR